MHVFVKDLLESLKRLKLSRPILLMSSDRNGKNSVVDYGKKKLRKKFRGFRKSVVLELQRLTTFHLLTMLFNLLLEYFWDLSNSSLAKYKNLENFSHCCSSRRSYG